MYKAHRLRRERRKGNWYCKGSVLCTRLNFIATQVSSWMHSAKSIFEMIPGEKCQHLIRFSFPTIWGLVSFWDRISISVYKTGQVSKQEESLRDCKWDHRLSRALDRNAVWYNKTMGHKVVPGCNLSGPSCQSPRNDPGLQLGREKGHTWRTHMLRP